MANMESQAVKVSVNGELRRFSAWTVPTGNFEALLDFFLSLHPASLGKGTRATISYVDTDDDVITIRSDEELREAYASYKGNVVKFTLSLPSAPQSSVGTDSIAGVNKEQGVGANVSTNDASTSPETATPSGSPKRCTMCKCRKGRGKACHAAKSANNRAIRLLADGEGRAACEILQETLVGHPGHKLLLYNLACALSRMGKTEAACATLEESIHAGFNKFKLPFLEQDFERMRNDPAFCKVLLRMAKKKYAKGKRHGFSAFLAPKIAKFRVRVDLTGFILECMRDPTNELYSLSFLYQSACVYAANGKKTHALELMGEICQRMEEKSSGGKHNGIPKARNILKEQALSSLREEKEMKALVDLVGSPKSGSRSPDVCPLRVSDDENDLLEAEYLIPKPSAPPTPSDSSQWSWGQVSEEEGDEYLIPTPAAVPAKPLFIPEPQKAEEDPIISNIEAIQEMGFDADPVVLRCLLEDLDNDVPKVIGALMGDN